MPNVNGSFSGNPKTEWLHDPSKPDREMKILEDFKYTDPIGKVWMAPKGSIIDGASIPRPLWTTVGSPYTDDYRNASIVHDVACDSPTIPRLDADKMFHFACLAGGCSVMQAWLLYAGVRIGAWASESKAIFPLSRTEYLYRLPGEVSPDEKVIQDKYSQVAVKLRGYDQSTNFEEISKVIEGELVN